MKTLNELVDDRIRLLLDSYEKENARLTVDVARVWRYVEALRNPAKKVRGLLIKAGFEAPEPPKFEHAPEPPRQMPMLT